MGLSAWWSSIRRSRVKEPTLQKPRDTIYDEHHQRTSKDRRTGLTYNATAWNSLAPNVEPPSKKIKRRSMWRPTDYNEESIEEPMPLLKENNVSKRRSFWRSEPQLRKMKSSTPVSAHPLPTNATNERLTTASAEEKKKRRSHRLSLTSITQERNRGKRRSWFGGEPDDGSSDDEVPTVPSVPTTLAYQRRRDLGNKAGMPSEEDFQPGMAITSDDLCDAAMSPPAIEQEKRRSRRLSLSRKKSSTSQASDANKFKRRSWFAASNGEDSDVPPVPSLVFDGMPSPTTASTFENDFERFLVNAHNAAQRKSTPPTDYEQFMRASMLYDASRAQPSRPSYRSTDISQQRPASTLAASSSRRASYAAPLKPPTELEPAARRSWRRSQHRRTLPANIDEDVADVMTETQQRDWEKLKDLMTHMDKRQDEGVVGMLREMDEDDHRDGYWRSAKRESVYENMDALAALEAK